MPIGASPAGAGGYGQVGLPGRPDVKVAAVLENVVAERGVRRTDGLLLCGESAPVSCLAPAQWSESRWERITAGSRRKIGPS